MGFTMTSDKVCVSRFSQNMPHRLWIACNHYFTSSSSLFLSFCGRFRIPAPSKQLRPVVRRTTSTSFIRQASSQASRARIAAFPALMGTTHGNFCFWDKSCTEYIMSQQGVGPTQSIVTYLRKHCNERYGRSCSCDRLGGSRQLT